MSHALQQELGLTLDMLALDLLCLIHGVGGILGREPAHAGGSS